MMGNRILAVVVALVVWAAIIAAAGVIIRSSWPAYAAVADAMTFTLPMMIARLSIGAVATLAAGTVAAAIERQPGYAALAAGVVLLVLFIPEHISLWSKFPVWYHLTFLTSLVPLTYLGSLVRLRSPLSTTGSLS